MSAYYNENNPYAVRWLRNLIAAGFIPAGDVDSRDVRDVTAADLAGYTQCHFFAGIGLWPYALRSAGWSDTCAVWTGSCPCQPFSPAGKRAGFADERHLWPAWFWLIKQCKPDIIFGEQVAGKRGLVWFDLVSTDLEACGYTFGAADFPSAGVGAPNIRQRLWWVADAKSRGCGINGLFEEAPSSGQNTRQSAFGNEAAGGLGNAGSAGLPHTEPQTPAATRRRQEGRAIAESGGAPDPWRELEWISCADGKRRPTQPGIFPLAPRHPGDVAKLRAYGNAINPQVATIFVSAWLNSVNHLQR